MQQGLGCSRNGRIKTEWTECDRLGVLLLTGSLESIGTAAKLSITHNIEREPSNLIVLVSSS
jgi:hypothetical protein